jgi:hypothetical protein
MIPVMKNMDGRKLKHDPDFDGVNGVVVRNYL